MKKMLLLATAMFLVGLFLGSVALAQAEDITVSDGTTFFVGDGTAGPLPTTAITAVDLAPSGGPSMLLLAAALLLGTGVLTYTILTRRT